MFAVNCSHCSMRFLADHFCDLEAGRMREHLHERHAELMTGPAELVDLLPHFGIEFESD